MMFDEKAFWQQRKACLLMGRFNYEKEDGITVAPCGIKRRCKNNHRRCDCWDEADICKRPLTAREKAEMRLFYELITGKRIKKRFRQILKIWTREYGILSISCKGCTEQWCSIDDKINPRCKQEKLKNIA